MTNSNEVSATRVLGTLDHVRGVVRSLVDDANELEVRARRVVTHAEIDGLIARVPATLIEELDELLARLEAEHITLEVGP